MNNNYVTPTDFANFSGISRQTLIFYEKKGIFMPAYKNEKGFRYYTMDQIYIIATIQSLQMIGLSLDEIKEYVQHRNAKSTYSLFTDKISVIQKRISKYQQMIYMMTNKIELINKAREIILHLVYVEYRAETPIKKTRSIPFENSEKEQYTLLGEHIRYRKESGQLLGHAVSGIVEWKKILNTQKNITLYQSYYTILDNPAEKDYDTIPAGNYLVIYHKGTYESSYTCYPLFVEYALEHDLVLDDLCYEESLIDELTEADPNNYITQINIRFHKK